MKTKLKKLNNLYALSILSHTIAMQYHNSIGLSDSPVCYSCPTKEETMSYILFECINYLTGCNNLDQNLKIRDKGNREIWIILFSILKNIIYTLQFIKKIDNSPQSEK